MSYTFVVRDSTNMEESIHVTLEKMVEKCLEHATDGRSPVPNKTAIKEVCKMLEGDPYCCHIAARVLALKIQSPHELEALQALDLLDTCLKRVGGDFLAEVGKFKFLNEMIKVVSPKYLGGRTAPVVRQSVLHLISRWIREYPHETKMREAYDMLRKQGVIKEDPVFVRRQVDVPVVPAIRPRSSVFDDEAKARVLQKLLKSKNQQDLLAANTLIKTMVREDERRTEQLNSRRTTELESVHNNARLLSEMLDSYRAQQSSSEELELIKELYQSCERLRPIVFRLASETQDNEAVLKEVLDASDELGQVFSKYTAVIERGVSLQSSAKSTSLLDLSTPSEEAMSLLSSQLSDLSLEQSSAQHSTIKVLEDIFGALPQPEGSSLTPPILQPVPVQQSCVKRESTSLDVAEKPSKQKAFEELDALGESLLKQSLPTSCQAGSVFTKSVAKVPMNLLSKAQEGSEHSSPAFQARSPTDFNLDFLVGGSAETELDLLNGDDTMVDISEDPVTNEISLMDISITIDRIKTGVIPPLTLLDYQNGITLELHFGRKAPKPDVSVIVVSTFNTCRLPVSNYQFQAVIPKTCTLRLLKPSSRDLPAHVPFLPPSAITQIMLIGNPRKEPVSFKFTLSYVMDGDTFTETGDIDCLPRQY